MEKIDWMYGRSSLSIMLAFFSLSVLGFANAQNILELSSHDKVLINPYARVFHSPELLSGQVAWEKIDQEALMETDKKVNPAMSFPKDSYWLVFSLANASKEEVNHFLEIDYPQMDFIELFSIKENKLDKIFTTGDNFPFDQRPIYDKNFILPLVLTSEDTTTYLLHLQKFNSTIRFPIYLHSERSFNKEHFSESLKYSLYFGFILLVAFAALVIGFVVKVNTFKIYAFYLLAFALWLFTRLGYSYQFFVSDWPEFNRHLLSAAGQLAIMGLIVYVRSFFNTKTSLPRFHKIMSIVLIFFSMGYVVWIMFPAEFVEYATRLFVVRYTLFSTAIIFAFTAAIYYRKTDRFRANMFLLAYSLFLSAILGKIVADYGVINEQKLWFDPILIGFLVEVIVLSTAMSMILKKTILKTQSISDDNKALKALIETKENTEATGYIKLNSKAIVPTSTIAFIKSDDHYLEFYLTDGKKEVDRNSLNYLEDTLPDNFIRTHRSYIVNLDEIKLSYSDKIIMNDGEEVKLSRTYKQRFQYLLNGAQHTKNQMEQ